MSMLQMDENFSINRKILQINTIFQPVVDLLDNWLESLHCDAYLFT